MKRESSSVTDIFATSFPKEEQGAKLSPGLMHDNHAVKQAHAVQWIEHAERLCAFGTLEL